MPEPLVGGDQNSSSTGASSGAGDDGTGTSKSRKGTIAAVVTVVLLLAIGAGVYYLVKVRKPSYAAAMGNEKVVAEDGAGADGDGLFAVGTTVIAFKNPIYDQNNNDTSAPYSPTPGVAAAEAAEAAKPASPSSDVFDGFGDETIAESEAVVASTTDAWSQEEMARRASDLFSLLDGAEEDWVDI